MKRLFILAIALFALLALTGCASSTGSNHGVNNAPHQAPALTPEGRAGIEATRTFLRVGLEAALQAKYKIPAEATSLAIAELDASIIDPALNGGKFQLATDPEAWKPVRDDLVNRSAAYVAKYVTSKGYAIDEGSAKALVAPLIDGIAAQVKALSTPAATPAGTTTAEVVHG